MRAFIVFLLTASLFTLFVTYSFAQAPSPGAGITVSLSEISACETNEWVELYNNSDASVSLASWKIEKSSSESATWVSKPLEVASISAKTYQKVWSGSSTFSNNGFSLRLIDSDGNTVEENSFDKCLSNSQTTWIKQGLSWARTTTPTLSSENILTSIGTPTPAQSKSPTPSPTATATQVSQPTATATPTENGPQPTSISLSEIYACQKEGEREWAELANSSSTSVTLTNWKLTDDDKNEQPIPSLTIAGKGYGIVEITKYVNGMLTNSGDAVFLYDGTGKKVDTYTYTACTKGSSFSKSGSTWQESTSVTKGTANAAPAGTQQPVVLQGDGGDGGDGTGTEEASTSGYVLGAETQGDTELPQETASPAGEPVERGTNWIALGSIGTGIVILLGVGGYYGWTQWKKRKKNS